MGKMMKVMFRRHRPVLLLLLGVMLVIWGVSFAEAVSSYHEIDHFTPTTVAEYKRDNPGVTTAEAKREIPKMRKASLSYYPQSTIDKLGWAPTGNFVQSVDPVWLIAVVVVGLICTGWDSLSGFDRFLFGLGRRKDAYWSRLSVYGGAVALFTLVRYALDMVGMPLAVGATYDEMTLFSGVALIGLNELYALSCFLFAAVVALLFGNFVAIVCAPPLLLSLGLGAFARVDHWLVQLGLGPGGERFFLYMLLVVVCGILLWLGERLYRSRSAEFDGHFLTTPRLYWPLFGLSWVAFILALLDSLSWTRWGLLVPLLLLVAGIVFGMRGRLHGRFGRWLARI
ncbi:hypothetical protein [Lacticaseibacillus mingshuiensis]|uniref:ABC-2 family transporter protein n=1 Tax=Lacticaseibacillus mingshuiensis TaxID=2799574 RepID=A0ABW4CEA2_9LACO|nr:hypothetical protein [Lacticaseibacillus mingshuiensis]